MKPTAEQMCKLWLSIAEVTAEQWKLLVYEYKSAEGLWEAFDSQKKSGFANAQRAVLEKYHTQSAMEEYMARLIKLKITALFQESEAYPQLLHAIDDPPYVLYCVGPVSALQCPMVSVIGTRRPSDYGKEMGHLIAKGLAEAGICVVSGLAYGIDRCAHEGALEANGRTIAVLGSGLNAPYPQEHIPLLRRIVKSGGLAISEFPLDASPFPAHFPYRNRIISGLSQALVFVEGKIKSGGMITVGTALSQGREVFAVPGRVGTTGAEGPHTILREGARLATCAEDILEDLGLAKESSTQIKPSKESAPASPQQQTILAALKREPMTLDRLELETGMKAEALMVELSVMEIMGLIQKEAGNLFSVVLSKRRNQIEGEA